MVFDIEKVARLLFLIFIVGLSVYFMYINGTTVERFEDQASAMDKETNIPTDKDKVIELIKQIYAKIFAGDVAMSQPSPKAIDFYLTFISQRKMSIGDLEDIIKLGAPTLEKSLNSDKVVLQEIPTEAYGSEDDVTEIYNDILLRNPDEAELYSFAKLLKTDSTFTLDKLKQVLYTSEEYKRLEKTQTNTAYAGLMGGVTERQLEFIVNKIYKDITGLEDLDLDTLKFLKKKFVSLNLDDKQFKSFLEKYLKNEPFVRVSAEQIPTPSKPQPSRQSQSQTSSENSVTKDDFQKFRDEVLQEVKASFVNKPKPPSSADLVQANPNRQVIEVLLRTAEDSQRDTYLDSQNVMDRIKDEAKCVFDKNSVGAFKNKTDDETLSDRQDKRNTDELRSTCLRNKNFLGVDENMVLDPSLEWSVPQKYPPVCVGGANDYKPIVDQTALIGTLLEDAKHTNVGSVLPSVPPR